MDDNIIIALEQSIEILEKHHSIKVGKFVLEGLQNGRINVNGYINYDYSFNNIKEIPQNIIKNELIKVKKEFNTLMHLSKRFEQFALRAGIDYYLIFDYQNAGIAICADIRGKFKSFI